METMMDVFDQEATMVDEFVATLDGIAQRAQRVEAIEKVAEFIECPAGRIANIRMVHAGNWTYALLWTDRDGFFTVELFTPIWESAALIRPGRQVLVNRVGLEQGARWIEKVAESVT